MRTVRCLVAITLAVLLGNARLVTAEQADTQAAAAPPASTSAKTWEGHTQEIEEFLKSVEIERMEDIGVGVTKPKKAFLKPGGPVSQIAWKPIKPGRYSGYWESYKAEIAAYELDKLLGMGMVPPTVEKRVGGELGAAVMWVAPIKSFKEMGGVPQPPPQAILKWNKQMIRAKMFDNLIYNKDPNLGNWLVDPEWNLILIDHTRSFTEGKQMAHEMTRIDAELWEKMKALDEAALTSAIGQWIAKGEIKGMLERRDKMQEVIDKLVKAKSEAAVFVR